MFEFSEVALLRRDGPAWRVYEFLADGRPRMRHEIEGATGLSSTHVSNILKLLWKRGLVLRSKELICFDKVVEKPRVGKTWSRFMETKPSSEIWKELVRRAIQWVHEARSIVRIVVMTEPEIRQWWEEKRSTL